MQTAEQTASRKLFDFIAATGLAPDVLYTHDQLSAVIEKPITENRTPLYAAIRLLERNHNRTLICVTGVGYRVARANESKDIADNRVSRAGRQVRRAMHTTAHTDRSALTAQERQELDQTRAGLLALERQVGQVKRQAKQHGEALERHDDRLDRLERELAEMRCESKAA